MMLPDILGDIDAIKGKNSPHLFSFLEVISVYQSIKGGCKGIGAKVWLWTPSLR
jgi:hypothetical protein